MDSINIISEPTLSPSQDPVSEFDLSSVDIALRSPAGSGALSKRTAGFLKPHIPFEEQIPVFQERDKLRKELLSSSLLHPRSLEYLLGRSSRSSADRVDSGVGEIIELSLEAFVVRPKLFHLFGELKGAILEFETRGRREVAQQTSFDSIRRITGEIYEETSLLSFSPAQVYEMAEFITQRSTGNASSYLPLPKALFGELSDTLIKQLYHLRQIDEWLVELNLRLVPKCARRVIYRLNGCFDFEDLCQEGRLALVRAVQGFDVRAGVRFSPYAWLAMRRAMLSFAHEHEHVLKTGAGAAILRHQAVKAQDLHYHCHGVRLEMHELAQNLGVSLERLTDLAPLMKAAVSLDASIERDEAAGQTSESPSLLEVLKDVNQAAPDENLLRRECASQLMEALGGLPAKQRRLMTRLYGFDGGLPPGLSTAAADSGLSLRDARDLRAKALKSLRQQINADDY